MKFHSSSKGGVKAEFIAHTFSAPCALWPVGWFSSLSTDFYLTQILHDHNEYFIFVVFGLLIFFFFYRNTVIVYEIKKSFFCFSGTQVGVMKKLILNDLAQEVSLLSLEAHLVGVRIICIALLITHYLV